ncbi:MAG: rod shape-determining protein MreD [Rhodospirillaceae bacterium]|nr:rod shape-determining protein MreD [Rhodospirillaceae bacterium]
MHQATLGQRLDLVARRAVPVGITLFLLLFSVTPLHIPGLATVGPMYTLIAVYFWSVYRPDGLGYGAAFAIGVTEDLIVGTPLGSTALLLLLCQWVVFHRQRFFNGRPFLEVWLAFAVIAFGAGILRWMCIGLITSGNFPAAGDLLGTVMLTVMLYPVIGWLLARAQMKLMVQP